MARGSPGAPARRGRAEAGTSEATLPPAGASFLLGHSLCPGLPLAEQTQGAGYLQEGLSLLHWGRLPRAGHYMPLSWPPPWWVVRRLKGGTWPGSET